MAQTIKVTCTGAGQHVNAIPLKRILQPTVVIRSAKPAKPPEIPPRSVFYCQFCKEGKIVVTREMVEEIMQEKEN